MSFLVIGNELDALIIGKFLKDRGWPLSILSKQRFEYKSDCELVNPDEFKEVGFDYKKGLLTEIKSVEVFDLYGNSFETKTNTVLVNLATYKNDLIKSIKGSPIYENSSYIDKNNENIFIQHGDHGTLIKAKHVIGVNDIALAKTIFEPLTKSCIRATLERKAEKGKLTLKFLDSGYMWIVNYSDRVAELCVVADNAEKEFDNYIFENSLKVIYKRNISIPYFRKERILFNKNVYLSGASALVTDNLTFYNLPLHLKFAELTGTFGHELMTKKNISYPYFTKEFDEELAKLEKKGSVFWGLTRDKKNELIHKMDFSRFVLDFDTAFDKLSKISAIKLKLLFK